MKHLFYILTIAITATADQKSPQEYLREANEQFTARLTAEVIRQHPAESSVLSAFSVIPLLANLVFASTGKTHDELLKTIDLPNDNVTKDVFSGLQANLKSAKGVTLNMANKIYVAKNYELNDEFAAVSRDVFDADAQNIDFSQPEKSAAEINSWVESHTNNRIKDLVSSDSINGDTRCILVNAIYFKGSWKDKFSADRTTERDFFVNRDNKVKVPMMYKDATYLYGESKELDAKLLEIPYEGDDASFMVILPNDIEGLPELQRKLAEKSLLKKAETEMKSKEVQVFLPKFKIETKTDLREALQNMNLKSIFSSDAQLQNLLKTNENLSVTDAIQKAFIEVNEEGAEAAAANEFGIQYLSAIVSEPRKFNADHPFMFFLKVGPNVLFSGSYYS